MKKLLLLTIPLLILVGCTNKYVKTLTGTWVAKPKNQSVFMIDQNTTRGGKEDYYLKFKADKTFSLEMEDYKVEGTYEVSDEGKITLKDEDNLMVEKCTLMGDTQLNCENYASLYEKNA